LASASRMKLAMAEAGTLVALVIWSIAIWSIAILIEIAGASGRAS
jgi:hypothetical protein